MNGQKPTELVFIDGHKRLIFHKDANKGHLLCGLRFFIPNLPPTFAKSFGHYCGTDLNDSRVFGQCKKEKCGQNLTDSNHETKKSIACANCAMLSALHKLLFHLTFLPL